MAEESKPLTMEAFLATETNFDELISKLAFAEATATFAASEQPFLFVKAARTRVQTMRRAMKARAALEQVEADTGLNIRDELFSTGQKITEAAVAARVVVSEAVINAQRVVRASDAEEELGKLIVEAYRHRRDSIRVIAEANLIEGNNPHTDELRFRENERLNESAQSIRAKARRARSDDAENKQQ
jgi:hypothetical protein